MSRVGIIGLGHVGAAVAYTLITETLVNELVLIDVKEEITCSEKYDLLDAQVFLKGKTKIITQDYSSLKEADIIVFCPGNIQALGEDGNRLKELKITSQIVTEVAPKIKESGFSGIILSITNPCDVITTYLQKLVHLPANQVICTGTMLDTARMKQAVSRFLGISSHNVGGYVYGEHGDLQFVAWSTVMIGNQPILNSYPTIDLLALEEKVIDGGWQAFTGRGYTNYGIAQTTTALIRMILEDTKTITAISVYDHSVQCYYGQPALVGRKGVERVVSCPLTTKEQNLLMRSIDVIKNAYSTLN